MLANCFYRLCKSYDNLPKSKFALVPYGAIAFTLVKLMLPVIRHLLILLARKKKKKWITAIERRWYKH